MGPSQTLAGSQEKLLKKEQARPCPAPTGHRGLALRPVTRGGSACCSTSPSSALGQLSFVQCSWTAFGVQAEPRAAWALRLGLRSGVLVDPPGRAERDSRALLGWALAQV